MKRYLSFLALTFVLTGCDAMTAHTDVVARVAQQELTIDEMAEMLAANPRIPAQTEVVGTVADLWVDYMLLAQLLAQDTTLADLDLAPMIDPYVERRTFTELSDQVVTGDTAISDEELRAAFEEQAPGQRVRARHILLTYPQDGDDAARDSTRALAEELRARAESGEDFAAMAQEHSQDPGSARDGGNLGWFERGRMVQPFEEAAFALAPGEVSDVVETPFGLHIIKVEERETPSWDPAQGEQFRQNLLMQRRQESLNAYVEGLREPVDLEIAEGATDVATQLAENPGERLRGRAASRALVSWRGGSVTARDYVTMLRRMPPQQQAQYASLPDNQMEEVLRNLATNELVLADARERGITIPESEQDSIRGVIRSELRELSAQAGLQGAPQDGESGPEAVERRVRSLLENVLAGRTNIIPLGALPYVLRDRAEWQINESAFPKVVDELESRRAEQSVPQPPTSEQLPQADPGAGQTQTPPTSPPDTSG